MEGTHLGHVGVGAAMRRVLTGGGKVTHRAETRSWSKIVWSEGRDCDVKVNFVLVLFPLEPLPPHFFPAGEEAKGSSDACKLFFM